MTVPAHSPLPGLERQAQDLSGRAQPPPLMFEAVRTRALATLDQAGAPAPKMRALVAPIGYGKTVLMTSLFDALRGSGRRCVWLTLDERDTTLERVLDGLEDVLEAATLKLGTAQALFRGPDSVEERVDALVGFINAGAQPFTLFLDNLHRCTDRRLGRLLDKLAFTTHPFVHLVLSSAEALPMDVARARMQGLLQAIGPSELALNEAEIAQLLGPVLCGQLAADGVKQLLQRTEGWPAAVSLARIVLSQAADPRRALAQFSGSDEALAPLLQRQLLQDFSEPMRLFLLQLAPLRSFSRELCEHAIGPAGLPDPLSLLIERQVFIVPLDRNGHTYRLHGLFRDFLLREAERLPGAARRREVLLRAAQWSELHGDDASAIEYAIAAGSGPDALGMLERIAARTVRDRGHVLPYIEWVEALQAREQVPGPEASYWYAWALAFYRRYDAAHRHIVGLAERMAQQGRAAYAVPGREELQRRIGILRASIDCLSDRLEEAQFGAAQWLADARSGVDDPFNLAAAHCIQSSFLSNAHRFVEARQALQSAREAAFQARSAYVDAWVGMYAGLIPIQEGDPAAAAPGLLALGAAASSALGAESAVCGTIAMLSAHCAVEMGRPDEARRLLQAGLAGASRHGFLDAAACGLEAAVRLWADRADDVASLSTLREIASTYAPRLSLMLSCYIVQRLVVLGRVAQAKAEAEHVGLAGQTDTQCRHPAAGRLAQLDALMAITQVRLMIAEGQFKSAQVLIDEQVQLGRSSRHAGMQVDLALAAAELALRTGEQSQAVRHVTRAIGLAALRGLVRPFEDHAQTLAAVIGETKVGAWGFVLPDERAFFLQRCRSLRFADPALRDRLAVLLGDEAQPPARLTARERELLALIEAGLSNQQIADRIGVSLTTVKWHLQNLYAKLGAANRSAALARARITKILQH